jgi:NADH-quinone oxidoreductase subunit N
VPFQFWAPDTYEGSPVPVAAFLSTASKAAGFAGLLQLMFVAFIHQAHFWTPVFAALSIATMAIGNLVALQQRQAVRLFAYSSIAQAGYMLLPFALVGASAAVNAEAFSATVLYILIYSVMNLGAFAVLTAMSKDSPQLLISDFGGLIKRAPIMAVAMTMFLLSLAGIPPTAGFWAKFFVFRAAIDRGGPGPYLAGVMVLFSVISLFYYLAIVKQMVTGEAKVGQQHRLSIPRLVGAVTLVAAFFVVAIGVYPDLFAKWPPLSTLVGR